MIRLLTAGHSLACMCTFQYPLCGVDLVLSSDSPEGVGWPVPLHFPSYLWITKIYLCFIHVIPIKCHPVLLELLSKKPKYLYNKANNIFLYVIILLIYYMIQECVICLIIQILVLWRHQYFSCISQIESFLSLATFFLEEIITLLLSLSICVATGSSFLFPFLPLVYSEKLISFPFPGQSMCLY